MRLNRRKIILENKFVIEGRTVIKLELREYKSSDIDKDEDDDDSYNDDYAIVRSNASSFTMNGLGYIVGGESVRTIWEYNPSTDLWVERTPMEGAARTDAVGFSINDRGFYMLGRVGSSYFDDAWEFKPTEEQNDDDN